MKWNKNNKNALWMLMLSKSWLEIRKTKIMQKNCINFQRQLSKCTPAHKHPHPTPRKHKQSWSKRMHFQGTPNPAKQIFQTRKKFINVHFICANRTRGNAHKWWSRKERLRLRKFQLSRSEWVRRENNEVEVEPKRKWFMTFHMKQNTHTHPNASSFDAHIAHQKQQGSRKENGCALHCTALCS